MSVLHSTAQVYVWQQDLWQHLQQRYPNIGHALLFYGKKGCGKEAFTKNFIAWILCEQKQADQACGCCQSCVWLESEIHPHLMLIQPEEAEQKDKNDSKSKASSKIKIEKIREILPFVNQTLEGWRIILIDPAEAMNIAASNALLKTLEEPSERVILILLAEHYLKIPATIRSRTQHFALDRISTQQAMSYLQQHFSQQQQSMTPEKLQILLNLSENMPLSAIQLAESVWFEHRQSFIDDWIKLLKQKDMPMSYAQKWQKALNFAEFNMLLEFMVNDLIRYKLNQPIYNQDLQHLEQLISQLSLEYLFDFYQYIQSSKQAVEQNVQTQLFVENYFIRLMNVS